MTSTTTINNHPFHTETTGKGTPVLFIHGLGSSVEDWEMQIPHFAKKYKTIAIDLRGHGKTAGSDGAYSLKQFAADCAGLIEQEGATHIVGISMGGMVAFQLAIDFPELVKSLSIINSYAEVSLETRKVRNTVRLRKFIPRLLGMKRMGVIIGKKLFPKPEHEHLRNTVAERWARNTVKDYTKSMNAIAGWTVMKDLGKITCPTLVVAAEHDYSTVAEKQIYVDLMPNAKMVVIPDSYHGVTAEKPDEVNSAISKFLGAL
ncbi:MAG: alpha/beta hydrolase [Rhizobiaceae bacterium]